MFEGPQMHESSTNQQFAPVNPKPFLKTLIDKPVVVRLKWNGTEYRGILSAIDNYMNLLLVSAVEIENGTEAPLGDIFIRCNNVLFVRENVKA